MSFLMNAANSYPSQTAFLATTATLVGVYGLSVSIPPLVPVFIAGSTGLQGMTVTQLALLTQTGVSWTPYVGTALSSATVLVGSSVTGIALRRLWQASPDSLTEETPLRSSANGTGGARLTSTPLHRGRQPAFSSAGSSFVLNTPRTPPQGYIGGGAHDQSLFDQPSRVRSGTGLQQTNPPTDEHRDTGMDVGTDSEEDEEEADEDLLLSVEKQMRQLEEQGKRGSDYNRLKEALEHHLLSPGTAQCRTRGERRASATGEEESRTRSGRLIRKSNH